MQLNSQNDQSTWLRLGHIRGITNRQWLQWLSHHPNWLHDADSASTEAWRSVGLTEQHRIQWRSSKDSVTKILDSCLAQSIEIIDYQSPHYPELLRQLFHPPFVLFGRGDITLLNRTQLAVVGSRMASQSALGIAQEFAAGMSEAGVTITSGMALGIDSRAHRGGLAGRGSSIAVLGTGVDVVYPKRNQALYQALLNEGLVLSEMWPGTQARAGNFPQRNRIIAALAQATLVVEAGLPSGSLITANLAAELGREVFALPGHIHNLQTQGVHYLIQQGAALISSLDNLLEQFQMITSLPLQAPPSKGKKSRVDNLATDPILDSVDYNVTAVDVIAGRNNCPVQDVMTALLEYELRGLVATVPGGYVKLRGK